MPNKKILLCWGYHRKGWLHAFNALNDDFEFHYLYYITKPEDEQNFALSNNLHYWSEFESAQYLLKKIRPDKVVFMGLEGANVIALNIIANLKGIETLVLQHGMFHTYEDYLNLAREERKQRNVSGERLENVGTRFLLRFFLRSLWWHIPALLHMWRLKNNKKKYLEVEALKNSKSTLRHASKYLVFTRFNASIYQVRDNIDLTKLIEVGNPEMDEIFKANKVTIDKKYYLLIDQPWSEVKDFNSPGFGITIDQTLEFHNKLALYASEKGAKLLVKLHPYSYRSEFFSDQLNLSYLRDVDIAGLIKGAEGVFGFSSTLLLSAIVFNKCCLFKIWQQSRFQDEMHELGVAKLLDYNKFERDDIAFRGIEDGKSAEFIKKYLYKTDGKSIERIKEVLNK